MALLEFIPPSVVRAEVPVWEFVVFYISLSVSYDGDWFRRFISLSF